MEGERQGASHELRVGLLGPVQLASERGELQITRTLLRVLLAALAVSANHAVPVDSLIDVLWQEDVSERREQNLQVQVYQLRRRLAAAEMTGGTRLIRLRHGYRLDLRESELDAAAFARLAAQGRRLAEASKPAEAAEVFGQALALWRGQALADVAPLSSRLAGEAARLEALRAAVVEDRADCLLAVGKHAEATQELTHFADRFPFRERLVAQLMLALYRSGRRAEALAAFGRARHGLKSELGLDPGPMLADLHLRILRDDQALGTATTESPAALITRRSEKAAPTDSGIHVPRQLPNAVPYFVGRAAALKELDSLLGESAGADHELGLAQPIAAAVTGMAGVGKTALAIQWARSAARRFPDGQLFVDLGADNISGAPIAADEAIGWLLTALVTEPGHIPAAAQARAGLYRSLLTDRRMLIVLDNAKDAAQIRPLIAGGPGSMVLVTSRSSLEGLVVSDGARLVRLDPLEPDEATRLLVARIGPDRARAEPAAIAELASACSGLPLALAIVAARTAVSPDLSLHALAARLAREPDQLDVLETGEAATSIRAVFSWSLAQLTKTGVRMFAFLHAHFGPDITAPAAASLASMTAAEAGSALAELTEFGLLTQHQPGRYVLHDLLRTYSGERARDVLTQPELTAASRRSIDHYLQTAAAAPWAYPIRTVPRPEPGVVPERLGSEREAKTWLRAEQQVLLRIIARASATDVTQAAWQIFVHVAVALAEQGRWADWAATGKIALEAVTRAGDHEGLGRVHRSLGLRAQMLGLREESDVHIRSALEHCLLAGDLHGQAHAHMTLAQSAQLSSRRTASSAEASDHVSEEAFHHAERAADLFRRVGDQHGQGLALTALADHYARIGRHDDAAQACMAAIDLQMTAGNAMGQVHAWHVLGLAHRRRGDLDETTRCFEQALSIRVELSPRQDWYRALIFTHLGDAHRDAGDHSAARRAWHSAARTLDRLHHPDAAAVHGRLSRAAAESSRPANQP